MSSSLERLADKRVELVYDRRTGTFDIVSLKDKRAVVRRASSHVTYRDDRGRRRTVMSTAAALRSVRRGSDGFGEMLEVRHEFDEGPRMLLRFHLGEGATHLLM